VVASIVAEDDKLAGNAEGFERRQFDRESLVTIIFLGREFRFRGIKPNRAIPPESLLESGCAG
jgi:hypothetical protein